MGVEKKVTNPWSKKIKSGGYEVLVTEITNGRDSGKFQITGTLNGKWKRFGVRTTQKKALQLAESLVVKEDLNRSRLNNLTDSEVLLVINFLNSGMTAEDIKAHNMRQRHTKSSTLHEVLEEWYTTQSERHEYSADYLSDWRYVKTNLCKSLTPHRQFNTIDTEDLENWLDSLRTTKGKVISPKRHKNIRGILVTVWKWACVKKRSYAAENYASAIEQRRSLARSGGHEVLVPAEFSLMLENVDQEFLPWLSISGFAGLRQSEICGTRGRLEDRLQWEDFDWVHMRISIRPETSKTRLQRFAPICPALAEWLSPWRNARGYVHTTRNPSSDSKKHPSQTKRLGALIGGWRTNCLRASRASYRLAETNDIGLTAMEDGHTEQQLRKNYLNPRFAEDAALWFSLTPSKVVELNAERIINFKKA